MRRRLFNTRGGYRRSMPRTTPAFNDTFSSAKKAFGPVAGRVAYQAYKMARSRGYTKKIDSFIDFLQKNPVALQAFKNAGASFLRSGVSIPGMGVLPSLRTKMTPTITNRGSGITLSTYTTSAKELPESVLKTGQRYVYNELRPESCFKMINSAYPTRNAVTEYRTFTAGVLTTLRSVMYTGGVGDSAADPGFLSQQAGSDEGKFYISNCRSEVMVTSSTNLNTTLRIYEVISKESSAIVTRRSPSLAWKHGVSDYLGTPGDDDYLNLGIYPGHSEAFRAFWHVDQITDIKLAAGATHKHLSKYTVNRRIPFSLFTGQDGQASIAGLTRYYLFVLTPTPVHDATTEANVSLGTVSCDIVITQTYEYYGMTGQRSVLTVVNTSDSVTNQEAITDSSNVETGVVN